MYSDVDCWICAYALQVALCHSIFISTATSGFWTGKSYSLIAISNPSANLSMEIGYTPDYQGVSLPQSLASTTNSMRAKLICGPSIGTGWSY